MSFVTGFYTVRLYNTTSLSEFERDWKGTEFRVGKTERVSSPTPTRDFKGINGFLT